MRAATVILALAAGPALALPPVTQEEAVEFHATGRCQMMVPGQGITRADGAGWIVSMLPGKHRFTAIGGPYGAGQSFPELDMDPGRAYRITLLPGGTLTWCPQFAPPGRDACGAVPPAFLYDATRKREPIPSTALYPPFNRGAP